MATESKEPFVDTGGAVDRRASELFEENQQQRYRAADGIFRVLMLVQWFGAIVLAITVSPYTWLGAEGAIHEHVLMAVVIGGVLAVIPYFVAGRFQGTMLSRQMIAISQVCWSAFLIHLTGGRIETHFHVFGSLAFLAFYRDWKILATATFVVALDHAVRGIFWPQSVFGVITESPFRWIEHAAWVVFEDIFLLIAMVKGRQMAYEICFSRARMEQSYRGEVDLLNRAIAKASCGIIITDANAPELPLTYVNKTFENITGYSHDEVIGKSCRFLQADDRNQIGIEKIRTAIKSRLNCQVLLRNYRKNGEFFWNELRISPVFDDCGNLTHFLGIQNDVTAREQSFRAAEDNRQMLAKTNQMLEDEIIQKNLAEKETERLNKELMDASRQAGMAEIATGVLHNVGNVMNSINISAESLFDKLEQIRLQRLDQVIDLISDPDDSIGRLLSQDEKGKLLPGYLAKLVEHLEQERLAAIEETKALKSNINHVAEIVSMQQTYARLGGLSEMVQIEELCEDAIRINDAGLVRHSVNVNLEFANVALIDTERHKVLQILVNLISNAKYAVCRSANPTNEIAMRTFADDAGNVCVEVQDNGIGIPIEKQQQVFQHGFTTKTEGHGFGLHSSILAAREIGGDITFESEGEGKGATFRLVLPLKNVRTSEQVNQPSLSAPANEVLESTGVIDVNATI